MRAKQKKSESQKKISSVGCVRPTASTVGKDVCGQTTPAGVEHFKKIVA
jgi:hypothetical protein